MRSDLPHGKITEIDTVEAVESLGVVAVFTASDLDLRPLSVGSPGTDRRFINPPEPGDGDGLQIPG